MLDLPKITSTFSSSELRNLDIDDLYVLAYIYETGNASTSILAKALRLTNPAVSHRFVKYIKVFGDDLFLPSTMGRCKTLSDIGREKIKPCAKAFEQIVGVV